MKKCPVCNSTKYAYSSITGVWFCRRCKFKNDQRALPKWYVDRELQGNKLFIFDKGDKSNA